jgi:transcriptional regulator with XRE-family HTH domain
MNMTLEQIWRLPATRRGGHSALPEQIDRGLGLSQGASIAKFCYLDKQPVTRQKQYSGDVRKLTLNELLARNLGRIKDARDLTLEEIAKKCRLSQRTIGYYLDPDKRAPTRSGKKGSAKLNEVDALAAGLGVSVWDLLGDTEALLGSELNYSRHAQLLAEHFDDAVPEGSKKAISALIAATQAIDAIFRQVDTPSPSPALTPIAKKHPV